MAFGFGTTTTKKESLINLDGTAIQNVTEFKYLGYKLSNEEESMDSKFRMAVAEGKFQQMTKHYSVTEKYPSN